VNFFGHAVIAARRAAPSGTVLGAMLPDFATMIGARPPRASHAALAAGIELHHATDEAFHAAPLFHELGEVSLSRLLALGVARGPARAVAHVGVELLLDGAFVDEPGAVAAYLGALADGPSARAIAWRDLLETARFEALRAALRVRGVRSEHGAPKLVTERLRRALEPRPRLALAHRELPLVERWAEELHPRVHHVAPALLAHVEAELDARIVGSLE
jgi:hypothetical protein